MLHEQKLIYLDWRSSFVAVPACNEWKKKSADESFWVSLIQCRLGKLRQVMLTLTH